MEMNSPWQSDKTPIGQAPKKTLTVRHGIVDDAGIIEADSQFLFWIRTETG